MKETKFSTSINIERDYDKELNYIVTANARQAIGKIVNAFSTGIHSFCIIGSYGTGKSSFLLAMEHCLTGKAKGKDCLIANKGQFNNCKDFEFVNIVGDYAPFVDTIKPHIACKKQEDTNFFVMLKNYYQEVSKKGKLLVIVIDEFGKILEYAAKNNPEKEMYFLQKFSEFVNDTNKNILFLTTLHQSFNAYAKGLSNEQKEEWIKVKGRITDIVFKEPIEQILSLTAKRITEKLKGQQVPSECQRLYQLALESKFLADPLSTEVVSALYPLDIISAYVVTMANQRYGQNERTLFAFLESREEGSVSNFEPHENRCYSLSEVYDYLTYHFHSQLNEVNVDSAKWSAIKIAIERIEGLNLKEDEIQDCISFVKCIGLLNIFASATTKVDQHFLEFYAKYAMDIEDAGNILHQLTKGKIIRYAIYKSKYILFEGTDVDIESGLFVAATECKRQENYADKIRKSFNFRVAIANAHYYRTGTPRFFEYSITSEPITKVLIGETDGYINLIFPTKGEIRNILGLCKKQKGIPIAYCIFKNADEIFKHLYEIDKLNWVKDSYIADDSDKVANREVENLIVHEKHQLNEAVMKGMFSHKVVWLFNGEIIEHIYNDKNLTVFLSQISDTIFPSTPIFKNELVNKYKPSGTISTARQLYLLALLNNNEKEDIGFSKDKYPPEKSIYLTLLKRTGIHKEDGVLYSLGEPHEVSFKPLWNACEGFLKSSSNKPRKLGELVSLLQNAPFGLKQGFISFWLPTYLIIKKDDYALYSEDRYVPYINKEVLELMQRNPNFFTIKAFGVEGVKRQFFEKYREAINLKSSELNTKSFIETIRPFLTFYKRLNQYAKNTKDISTNSRKFRDIISQATDPEKTFFEILPEELGFKEVVLTQNPDAIESFVEVIQDAIRGLRSCYDEYLKKVEQHILLILDINESDFVKYKPIIDERYRHVTTNLMPFDIKNFHSRLIGQFSDKKTWLESICYVVLNKPLENIKDSEKSYLNKTLQDKFFQLDEYVEMHKSQVENIVRFHITENISGTITKQVVIPKGKEKTVETLESKIEKILSDDDSVNVAALIQILKKKM